MIGKVAVGRRRVKNENILDTGFSVLIHVWSSDVSVTHTSTRRRHSGVLLCLHVVETRVASKQSGSRHSSKKEHKATRTFVRTPRPVTRSSTPIGTKMQGERHEPLDQSDGWA